MALRYSLAFVIFTFLGFLLNFGAAQSSFSLAQGKPSFTFDYSTSSPDGKNWIGVYNVFGGGPDNGQYSAPALSWAYAPGNKGSVRVPTEKLAPGRYKAYFLAKGGYQGLANPIEVILGGQGPISFLVDSLTTHNARQGDEFKATVSGLLVNAPDQDTKFVKLPGGCNDEWVQVSSDGRLSGTPSSDIMAVVVIEATASNGSKARLDVMIPIRNTGALLVDRLKVMSFNMWHGGTRVNDYHRKQIRFLTDSQVDIVGLQETNGGHTARLAQALGWYFWEGRGNGIISRYPIVNVFPEAEAGGGVRIALDGQSREIIVWNVHLGYTPYGPYDFCFNQMSVDRVMQREGESGRTRQIQQVVDRMKNELDNSRRVPVLLTGDFNAPSHLDWTDATRGLHCNIGSVSWPSSVIPSKAGLVDSYREMNKNPSTDGGITWSPIYLSNNGRREPMDRIDYVYYKGGLKVLKSETRVVGKPSPQPNHKDNEWTSDHAAVISEFGVDAAWG